MQTKSTGNRQTCYRDVNGVLFRCLCVGYHMHTGEQYAVLRKVSDGTAWIIPAGELYEKRLINGEVRYLWTLDENTDIIKEDDNNYRTVTSKPYSGTANDLRPGFRIPTRHNNRRVDGLNELTRRY